MGALWGENVPSLQMSKPRLGELNSLEDIWPVSAWEVNPGLPDRFSALGPRCCLGLEGQEVMPRREWEEGWEMPGSPIRGSRP